MNKGALIRSKEKIIEEGEKPTKYFFSIQKLEISDGIFTEDPKQILKHAKKYYEELHKKANNFTTTPIISFKKH